jgi:Leucine-rich repeat (LRR) protein
MADSVEQELDNARARGAEAVDLSRRGLVEVPVALRNLPHLTRVDLSGNQLTTLPEWLSELTRLRHLNLRGNRLATLPESLGTLGELEVLELADNELLRLPWSLGMLSTLRELDVARNRLQMLPPGVAMLPAMQGFELGNSDQVTSITRAGILRPHAGRVSIWLGTWYHPNNSVIGRYDEDKSETGIVGPDPASCQGSWVDSWRDAAADTARTLGIAHSMNSWMLFDYAYDAEPGPMGGPGDGVFLGAIPYQT